MTNKEREEIDKFEKQIASMSKEQWADFVKRSQDALKLATLKATFKSSTKKPTSKEIIETMLNTSDNN
jgi:hypothetical protein